MQPQNVLKHRWTFQIIQRYWQLVELVINFQVVYVHEELIASVPLLSVIYLWKNAVGIPNRFTLLHRLYYMIAIIYDGFMLYTICQ